MANRTKFKPKSVGVVGAGAWGTALAETLCRAGMQTLIWARNRAVVAEINGRHCNETYLPGARLDPGLRATHDLAEAAAQDLLLLAVPAQHMRATVTVLRPALDQAKPLVICAKGFEQGTDSYMTGVILDVLGQAPPPLVLSGPSFAAEVVRGLPTAVTLACSEHRLGLDIMNAMGSRALRIYLTDDLAGVQIGGAVKNVLAIAAGIVAGSQLGASAQAALVTRGFYELSGFARTLGAKRETLTGLSCLGDLILTCNSALSRNFTLGRELGEGRPLAEIMGGRRTVVEGVFTASAVMAIANSQSIEMPICSAVHRIVAGELTVESAIDELLARPLRQEQ